MPGSRPADPACPKSSSSVPVPLAAPPAAANVLPACPVARRALNAPCWKGEQAHKGRESRDYESICSRMPHSELDGTAKHSVYATVAGRTKQGKRAPLIKQHSLDGCAGLAVAPSIKNGMAHAIRAELGAVVF